MSFNPHPQGGIQNAISGGFNNFTNQIGHIGQVAHDSVFGTSHQIQQGAGDVAEHIVHGPGKFIDMEAHNIGTALGGAQKTLHDTIFGEANALQKSIVPYLLVGGAAVLILLLVMKRR
jgi:hypothetical protein